MGVGGSGQTPAAPRDTQNSATRGFPASARTGANSRARADIPVRRMILFYKTERKSITPPETNTEAVLGQGFWAQPVDAHLWFWGPHVAPAAVPGANPLQTYQRFARFAVADSLLSDV